MSNRPLHSYSATFQAALAALQAVTELPSDLAQSFYRLAARRTHFGPVSAQEDNPDSE
ncbi:MAG: hypothetical protein AB7G06_08510 [Bdellovibrionales bacterium]